MSTRAKMASGYAAKGWVPVPIPPGEKGPRFKGWPSLRVEGENLVHTIGDGCRRQPLVDAFAGDGNIGILMGDASGSLVDVDLDDKNGDVERLAPRFLPPTPLTFGRASKPRSHWLYQTEPAHRVGLQLPKDLGGMMLEIRSTGCQTMAPGSVHPSGEWVQWSSGAEPTAPPAAVSRGVLDDRCRRLCAAALLVRGGLLDDDATAAGLDLDSAELCARVPAEYQATVRQWFGLSVESSAGPRGKVDASNDVREAMARYVRERTPSDWPESSPGPCPAHSDDGPQDRHFKRAPDSHRWLCFGTHPADCGKPTAKGDAYTGDVLDLDAYRAGHRGQRGLVDYLKAQGYLSERAVSEWAHKPPPLPSVLTPPKGPAAPSLELPTLGATVDESFRRFKRRGAGEETPIPTPWPSLNKALNGGFWPGMHVLVGNTGSGKSQFALQIAVHGAELGVPVLYLALELGHADTDARVAALLTDAGWSDLYYGRNLQPLCDDLAERIAALPFVRIVAKPYGWPYGDAEPLARAMLDRYRSAVRDEAGHVTRPFLVVLDYLQIVSSNQPNEELRERIGKASGACRAIARELDAAVLVVSSTSRENGGALAGQPVRSEGKGDNKGPVFAWDEPPSFMVGKGKEAGEIEFCADSVLVLAREVLTDAARLAGDPTPIHVAVAKQRAGAPSWVSGMYFNGHRFTEGKPGPGAVKFGAWLNPLSRPAVPSPGPARKDDCGFTLP
ncbi:MAG: bifunctional DNA primase/polymerase [Myxococcales bacterium]|nr:bifunctional DNA primase/polymerase [Myxococcales bacterium]